MNLYQCKRCGKMLWEDEMVLCKRPEGQESYYTYCRTCHRIRNRLWLEKKRNQNPHYSRDQARKFRDTHPNYNSEWTQNNKAIHPLKTTAYNRANRAELEMQPCEVCGDPNAYKHHDDYSKPLEVKWLCPKHHQRLHAEISKGG